MVSTIITGLDLLLRVERSIMGKLDVVSWKISIVSVNEWYGRTF